MSRGWKGLRVGKVRKVGKVERWERLEGGRVGKVGRWEGVIWIIFTSKQMYIYLISKTKLLQKHSGLVNDAAVVAVVA